MTPLLAKLVALQLAWAEPLEDVHPLQDDCALVQHANRAAVTTELQDDEEQADQALLQHILGATEPGVAQRHPFWELDFSHVWHGDVLLCCLFLGMAGILCSAGGIGGGGIYVTVLMVAGTLTPHDAVPLSKAVVFFGSMSSLVLNLRKSMSSDSKQSLIDYNICRLVIPAALAGTLGGVYLNRQLGDAVLLSVLTCILLFITAMTLQKFWEQRAEERAEAPVKLSGQAAAVERDEPEKGEADAAKDATYAKRQWESSQLATQGCAAEYGSLKRVQKCQGKQKSILSPIEALLSVITLLTVVGCGVLRFHAGTCQTALMNSPSSEALHSTCHHPTMRLFGSYLQVWMADSHTGEKVLFYALAVPLSLCFAACFYYCHFCVTQEKWSIAQVTKYSVMASTTGCLAGLVGIGGGLIFSPVFLISGVEPAVAVATSSTCVIFTSSSTTLQYLLTDRIITSLTIVYGLVNLVASYVGTSLVHMLQDGLGARKSYITGIVAIGVVISTVLAAAKLWDLEHAVHPVQMH